jgi:succinate dehydrogenase / fumarate reductase flavoprotein subunit
MEVMSHDILIIGGGLAGQMAALEAAQSADAAIITKVHPLRSHSGAAQGGINAGFGNVAPDDWKKHAFDTVKGSDFLADQDSVEVLCQQIMPRIVETDANGALFDRLPDGRLAQRPFGGGSFPRTCYSGDETGHELLNTLYEQTLRDEVKVYEEWLVTGLAVEGGRCVGAFALDLRKGQMAYFRAKAVILATGGAGRMYQRTTNSHQCTGDGIAMAYRAGAAIGDMEFIQFHPTTLTGTNILVSEAARGEGGKLLNAKEERFMARYAPKAMELAPRDIVTRSIMTEIENGNGFGPKGDEHVWLDLTGLGKELLAERLPQISKLALDFVGVDASKQSIPVQPAQHYTMGGVRTGNGGESTLPGLYAAGECACVSVHGANRLGGNSLAETLVFGKIAGASALREARKKTVPNASKSSIEKEEERIGALVRPEGESTAVLRKELQQVMWEKVGVFRTETELREALCAIRGFKTRYRSVGVRDSSHTFNTELMQAIELGFMLDCAELAALGAMMRQESRGSHSRRDFPQRDDTRFLKHTIMTVHAGEPEVRYEDVRITTFRPEARTY